MTNSNIISLLPSEFDKSRFQIYLIILGLLFFAFGWFLILKGKFLFLLLVIFSPVLVLIVTQPKLAIAQYVFSLFFGFTILSGQPWLVTDISGLVLISAALLDFFSENKLYRRLPRLSLNFLSILVVVFTAAIFSYQPVLALTSFGRIALLFFHFLAIYRLSNKVPLSWSLNLFFWLAVIHSIILVIPFLTSGGTLRTYGPAPVEMPMLALVIATVKYQWAEKGRGWIYLLAMVVIFFALLSQQFRSLILMAVAMSALAAFIARRRARRVLSHGLIDSDNDLFEQLYRVRKRPIFLLAGLSLCVLSVIAIFPELFTPLFERFISLFSSKPSGSLLLRYVLWKTAWTQFLESPLVGVGPGLFRQIHDYVPAVRMDFYHWYVQGLSAHNLILHFLAETGIFGGIAVLAVIINQMKLSVKSWRLASAGPVMQISAILLGISLTFLATALTESSWLWGQSSFLFAFFLALIARNNQNLTNS